ncbi:MAG: DNA-directed RNA polymerase subunit omega [Methylacidiphilaceae bacterium]|nr:DNA-directed RNA polymerase subunit omega [Candidatus Methylacidiphilaceae bacterium]
MAKTVTDTITTLLSAAFAKMDSPEVLINAVSSRVRLLAKGARPLVEVHPQWSILQVALKEIADGKLTVAPAEEVPTAFTSLVSEEPTV